MVFATGIAGVADAQQDHRMDLSAVMTGTPETTLVQPAIAQPVVAVPAVAQPAIATPAVAQPASQQQATERTSAREVTISGLKDAIEKMVAEHANGSTDILRSGQSIHLVADINDNLGATERHSVNVQISYDARPVGGILNIRVELVPDFGGIGSAVRPAASREFAQAVDSFDDDFIGQTITNLTNELAAEFAAK